MDRTIGTNELFALLSRLQRSSSEYKPQTEKAKRYLERGLNFRYLLMKESVLLLVQGIEALPHNMYEIWKINIAINSIYVNVKGTIDNMAWIVYLDVIKDGLGPASISFTSEKYRKKIAGTKLGALLSTKYHDWLSELKKKRDPIAHRLPLYVPPKTITNEADREKAQKYLDMANQKLREGNRDQWSELLGKHGDVGAFVPVVILDDVESMELSPYGINSILLRDFEMLAMLASDVFEAIQLHQECSEKI